MKEQILRKLVRLTLFLVSIAVAQKAQAQQNYYVLSVEDKIFANQKLLKEKDEIGAKAVIKFNTQDSKAFLLSPTGGKFVLTSRKIDSKGELVAPIENVVIPSTDYYLMGTRTGSAMEMSPEDFGSSIHDNPADSDLITVYFWAKEPSFVFPVPANLLKKDAKFYLQSDNYKIPIPVKDGKLVFSKQMVDDSGKTLEMLKLKEEFDFLYNRNTPPSSHQIGRVKFQMF